MVREVYKTPCNGVYIKHAFGGRVRLDRNRYWASHWATESVDHWRTSGGSTAREKGFCSSTCRRPLAPTKSRSSCSGATWTWSRPSPTTSIRLGRSALRCWLKTKAEQFPGRVICSCTLYEVHCDRQYRMSTLQSEHSLGHILIE